MTASSAVSRTRRARAVTWRVCAGCWCSSDRWASIPVDLAGDQGRLAQMVMAADYPFMDVLWSMIIFFFWVIWIWIVVTVLIDVFRRHDIGGFSQAAWGIFVVIPPWLGALIFLISPRPPLRAPPARQASGPQE